MSDIGDELQSIPTWVWGAAGILVALILAFHTSTGSTGVASLTPIPADPNLTALAASESADKTTAFQSLASLLAGENEVAGSVEATSVQAQRDTSIATLQANVQNEATQADLAASEAADSVQQTVGLATVTASQETADAATNASVAINQSNNNAATYAAAASASTAQKANKGNVVSNIIGDIAGTAISLFGHF